MSKVQNIDISNITSLNDLTRFLSPFMNQVFSALNSGLNFQDNFKASVVQVSFPASANQNLVVKHNLPSTPIGYIPIQFSAAANIYNGSSLVLGLTFANLKCSASGITATILFF